MCAGYIGNSHVGLDGVHCDSDGKLCDRQDYKRAGCGIVVSQRYWGLEGYSEAHKQAGPKSSGRNKESISQQNMNMESCATQYEMCLLT